MEYRFCRDDESAEVRRLWNQCFGEEEPWTSWFFANHFKPQQTWVAVDSGRIVGQAHLLPHRLFLRGAWREAVYYVGVCVDERLRGTGIGRDLMVTSLAELRLTGIDISILQPRWPEFYRLLGWDFCYSRQKYYLLWTAAGLVLPALPPAISWEPDSFRLETFAGLYAQFMQGRHGYADRSETDWRLLLKEHRGDGGKTGLIYQAGKACAYVFYKAVGEFLYIRELAWTEDRQADWALAFLRGEAEALGTTQLEWDEPSGESVSVLSEQSGNDPFLMGRLSDVQAVLAAMEYPPDLTADFAIELTDPLLKSNQGTYIWRIAQGQGCLIRQSPELNDSVTRASISIDIAKLSQLYFGWQTAREIMTTEQGLLVDEIQLALLEKIFPACRNYISEYF